MVNNGITAPLRRLTELAGVQAGIISRPQALSCGMTRDAIQWAVKRGAWQRMHPGVYATFTGQAGHPAQRWAALLYAGEGAILSHETAAELLGLTDQRAARIHVTIPSTRRVLTPPGVVIHVSCRAYPKWRYTRGTPPHTMAEDTVIDLVNAAGTLDEAAGWVTAAFARRVTGEWPLRQAMAERSRLRWRDQDRRRDNQAAATGGSTLRYDWTAVTRRACETAAEVYAALRERGYRGTLKPCSPACRSAAVPASRIVAGAGRPRG